MVNKHSKQRLIFALYYKDGQYCLSRNYSLQTVGNSEWLDNKFNISKVAEAIDELVIFNVSDSMSIESFSEELALILPNFFVPVSVGGALTSESQVKRMFELGADRIIFNTAILMESQLPSWTINQYGVNAVLASVDFKLSAKTGGYEVFSKKVPTSSEVSVQKLLERIAAMGIKEVVVGSVDHDGTGFGFDFDLLNFLTEMTDLKLIPSGGMDTPEQVIRAFKKGSSEAVVASHLFNFMGDQLQRTRAEAINAGINLARWEE